MKNKGYMVLEALIAIVIFGMLVVAIFPSLNFLVARTRRTKEDSQAAVYLQEGMEATYNILTQTSDPDLSNFSPGEYQIVVGSTWSLSEITEEADKDLDGHFQRVIRLDPVCRSSTGEIETCSGSNEDSMSKKVTTTIAWTQNGQPQKIEAEMIVVKL